MKKLHTILLIILTLGIVTVSGCQKAKDSEPIAEEELEEVTKESEPEVKDETVTVDSLEYISVDGKIKLELPNETWKCTEDSGTLITFTSDAGVINIMYMEGQDVATIQVPADQEAYEAMIKGNFSELQYDVQEFERWEMGDRIGYKVVVAYEEGNPDRFTIGYGSYASDSGYTVAATLLEAGADQLEAVKESVFGIEILE